ncbi:hypothetical protein CPB85DRAFT_1261743 [Mucidula mucida]|nr:hypothetical protein CPB85DRAFT_1261743 [Mucidula mucida]
MTEAQTEDIGRPVKRPRLENYETPYKRDLESWFADGSIISISQEGSVHQGVLARTASSFRICLSWHVRNKKTGKLLSNWLTPDLRSHIRASSHVSVLPVLCSTSPSIYTFLRGFMLADCGGGDARMEVAPQPGVYWQKHMWKQHCLESRNQALKVSHDAVAVFSCTPDLEVYAFTEFRYNGIIHTLYSLMFLELAAYQPCGHPRGHLVTVASKLRNG